MEQSYTLVFTDLVDSTAMNARLGDRDMQGLWRAHDQGSRRLLRQWRGQEVDRSDGFLAIFVDAMDGAEFLLGYHVMLRGMPVPMRARAGIHVGHVQLQRNEPVDVALGAKPLEVVGLAKAFCARLMALASAEQTLASAEAAAALSSSAHACVSHGHWRLKGMDDPVEVFELVRPGCSPLPPRDAEKAFRVTRSHDHWVGVGDVPRSLPAEPDDFLGREAELNELHRRIAKPNRLVTVTGPGGMGKTRLAQRYGWGWLGSYPGGVYFCDLVTARTSGDIVAAVARSLQVPLGAQPSAQLTDAVAGLGNCLLILDNFEQVVASAEDTVGAWMRSAPDTSFIVTSRERLGLPGEQMLALEPLATDAAVGLFHRRARAAFPGYCEPSDAVMAPLVGLLDGMPLAIELAAARAAVMEPSRLLSQMGERFRLLASRVGRPQRQATLVGALQWSWELLTDAERRAMAQLSVFEGSFTVDAAEAVLDLSGVPGAPWHVDLLQSLVDKSLLRSFGNGRHQFLNCIREFAAEKLVVPNAATGSGPLAAQRLVERHRHYYASLSEPAAVADGCVEMPNLTAACRGACAAGDTPGAVATLRLAWLALRLVGPFSDAVDLARQVLPLIVEPSEDAATAHWVHGAALYASGAVEEADFALARGLSAISDGTSAILLARLHCALGEVTSEQGKRAQAELHLETARRFAERDGGVAIQCQVLNALGALAQDQLRLDAARHLYATAIAIAEQAGDRRWQAAVGGNLAVLDLSQGRLDDALRSAQRARNDAVASGDLRWIGNCSCNLGLIYAEQEQLEDAERYLSEALNVARRLGHKALEFTTLCNLGLVCEKSGDLVKACEHHRSAVAGAQRLGDSRVEAQLRSCLGSALARRGLHDQARSCLQEAVTVLGSIDPVVRGLVLCSIAENELRDPRSGGARRALEDAAAAVVQAGADASSELGRRYAQVCSISRD